jgi:hypothetical protein
MRLAYWFFCCAAWQLKAADSRKKRRFLRMMSPFAYLNQPSENEAPIWRCSVTTPFSAREPVVVMLEAACHGEFLKRPALTTSAL